MSNFELADIDTSFEPSLKLVDTLVNDLFWAHRKENADKTPWLVPSKAINSALPDAFPHARIEKIRKGWQFAIAQRFVDHNFPKHTATKMRTYYYHPHGGIQLSESTIKRNTFMPSLHPSSDKELRGDHTEELFNRLAESALVPKSWVYQGFSGELAERKGTIEKDRNLLRHGSRVMQLMERNYLGFSPDFSQY